MLRGRGGLGRGLGALLPGSGTSATEVDVNAIVPNPRQPRHHVDTAQLEELAASVREHGVIQPLVVRAISSDAGAGRRYELIAGERRWHAARLAGLTRVPVVVKDVTPQQVLEMALVENIQRADLNPLEEAAAYRQLMDEFRLTQEQVALRVGKSRVAVANAVRLLGLSDPVKSALADAAITEGHARALLGLPDGASQVAALRQVRNLRLTVRQTEEFVRRTSEGEPRADIPLPSQPADARALETRALEDQIRAALGTRVNLIRTGQGGRLVIHFYSEEDLQALLDRLTSTD
jgi:ParB family transcriptional regulator, chromosome partitioning protein